MHEWSFTTSRRARCHRPSSAPSLRRCASLLKFDSADYANSEQYYLRYASIENFNRTFRASMSEADVLAVISSSVEFDQLKVRDSEVNDLQMMEASESVAPCKIKVRLRTLHRRIQRCEERTGRRRYDTRQGQRAPSGLHLAHSDPRLCSHLRLRLCRSERRAYHTRSARHRYQ